MPSSTNQPIVLVTGGTGKQGGATVTHLLAGGRVRVRALTRDPQSAEAKRLVSRGVESVRGSFDDPTSLKAALSGVSAAFSVQTMAGKGGVIAEERQGKAFADAVKAAGTPHLVYSSVEGAERDTDIPHFESKGRIAIHLPRSAIQIQPRHQRKSIGSIRRRLRVRSALVRTMRPCSSQRPFHCDLRCR